MADRPSALQPNVPIELSPTDFEQLVVEHLRSQSLDLTVDVKHLEAVYGEGTSVYKIDAVARFTQLGGAEFVVLVECKHQSRPVEREDVLVLFAKLVDTHASKGIIFSTSGFQRGAVEFARTKGIACVLVADGRFTYETRSRYTRVTINRFSEPKPQPVCYWLIESANTIQREIVSTQAITYFVQR